MDSTLKICKFYNAAITCSNPKCPHLHICKHYIYGLCKFGVRCKRSHDILTPKVQFILEQHGFDTRRRPKDILNTLRYTLPNEREWSESVGSVAPSARLMPFVNQTLPRTASKLKICKFYNVATVGESACRNPICPHLHICKHYVYGQCMFGSGCKRSHNILTANVQFILEQHGIDTRKRPADILNALKYTLLNEPEWLESDYSVAPSEREYYDFEEYCDFEEYFNYHCNMQYQSLYNQPGANRDDRWTHTKLQYREPAPTGYDLHVGTLAGKEEDRTPTFQRMSTDTSAMLDTQSLDTNWIWYWLAPDGNWTKYSDASEGQKATITSFEIEQAFVANPKGQLKFVAKGNITHEYIIDFTKLKQINRLTNTERDVTRQRECVHRADCEQKFMQPRKRVGMVRSQSTADISTVAAPSHWLIHELPGVELLDHSLEVKLDSITPEFKHIEDLFRDKLSMACGQLTVRSIHRIENGDLYCNYQSKKLKMKKQNNGTDVEERQLFHGTKRQYVDVICKQGFDFRLNGISSGTAYGKGSYFATTSEYSHRYTASNSKYRKMFIAKVLVGDYVRGNPTYCRPPPKRDDDPLSPLFDSCVNDTADPSIFVIFENGQVYPEYLVKYQIK